MEIRQGRPDGFFLFAEIGENFLHALGLVDAEGTAAVAVAAGDAVLRGFFEREIVLLGKTVAELCKVIVFVDEGNIEPGGAGVAVFAVDTFAERVFGRKGRAFYWN